MLALRDIMTADVATLNPDDTLRDAINMLTEQHITGAPVVSGTDVVGVISAMDIIDFASTALRLMGFRTVLIATSLSGAVLMAANAFFTPTTAHWIIITVLVAAGFSRSLYFTANNALVFAEIDDRQASQATAISAVAQQVSIALGVAIAGMFLEAHHLITGEETGLSAFFIAFLGVAALAACSVFPILGLAPEAGRAVSGHGGVRQPGEGPHSAE